MITDFSRKNATPISEADYQKIASDIGCEIAAIKAVSQVEAPRGGFFLNSGNNKYYPVILFESHVFHKLTKGKYDKTYPELSTPTWVRNYGSSGIHQYDRLNLALKLSYNEALESASWGKYQIMGMNFYNAGYDNIEAFVEDMCEDEANHLEAFSAFVQNTGIAEYLINKDWSRFAAHYNGSGQVDYYANKIEYAYQKLTQP